MDPFLEGKYGKVVTEGKDGGVSNTSGGKLIFQLGNISEDLIPDSKHGFENGLPPDGNLSSGLAQETTFGEVTTQTYLNNAFNIQPESRANQDVGLDGIPDAKEATHFSNFVNAHPIVASDPSGDDFQYFLDNVFDDRNAQLLERYKNFNGMDGNSPIIGNSAIARSGSQTPDNEDLNADNTLSELEEYYEYTVDLKKGQLDVGKPFIVDKILASPVNVPGEHVNWYLFRVPIRGERITKGEINGFKSIRYMRMLLTGFKEPVVLRLANFRMVGSRWRKFQADLRTGFDKAQEPYDDFTVSVVNLEENGFFETGSPASAYMIPPGVRRDRDNTSTISRQLNEQSVQVCVDELKDGDARAIYKISGVDLFNYGRVKMYLHANSKANDPGLKDDDLTAFLRLGTDTDQNYYEIEIPLKISDPSIKDDAEVVWPAENQIDLDLNSLLAMKLRRDNEPGNSTSSIYTFPEKIGRHTIRILGRPDLSSVQVMMIGVRNPRSDNRSHSACIWANELRVTDFNRVAGYAMSSTVSAKLADFATVNGALRHTTFGFGNVSSKIGERTRDETTTYDVSANVNVDKILPGNLGIKVPMFVGYQNTTINPQYDPANPDTRIAAALRSFSTPESKQSFIKLIQDRKTNRSFSFINVRKVKVKADAPVHIYDIENLAFSYSYSEENQTNFFTKEALQQKHHGSVAYNFSPKATGIEPFKNSSGLKSPYLKFIKDFNIGLLPTNISIRGDLDRSFNRKVYRNATDTYGKYVYSPPNYLKYFTFNRQYNMRWGLTKSLTFEYTAQANAIIDEPKGDIDTQEKKDSIMYNLKQGGRMKNFSQTVTVNYTLPLDKFPLTDWLGAEYRYQAGYNWKAGPINALPDAIALARGIDDLPDTLDFKNTIQNNRENNVTGKLDMVKLYNKIKFLKEINSPPKAPVQIPGRQQGGRPTTSRPPPKADTVKTTPAFVKSFFRLLMSLRSISGTYTLNEGTILPGYNRTPKYLGMDEMWSSPGWNFVLGSQDPNIRYKLADPDPLKSKITTLPGLTTPFVQTRDQNFSLRGSIEPSPDLKIQIDLKKESSTSYQEIFRFDQSIGDFSSLNPSRSGAYKVSYLTIKTAFDRTNNQTESAVFKKFEENLGVMKSRFEHSTEGLPSFDSTQQDVVIPAFIAAYSGKDPNKVSLSPFPSTPLPNWRLDYNGLSKVGVFKDLFQSVTISSGYQSSYSVMNYSNSLEVGPGTSVAINRPIENYNVSYFGTRSTDDNTKYVPVYVISSVMISEQFAPLIGVNVRTKSRMTARAEYKTKRDLALNISNAQITEMNNKDVAFELGYTKNNMKLPFKDQGRTIVLKNDVTFRVNLTVTNSKTIQRKINEVSTITNGNINYQLRPNVSYVVNQKLTIQGYFERTINTPVVTTSYRRATTRFGIQVRFSLAQ
jgi:cell surface protein SprA